MEAHKIAFSCPSAPYGVSLHLDISPFVQSNTTQCQYFPHFAVCTRRQRYCLHPPTELVSLEHGNDYSLISAKITSQYPSRLAKFHSDSTALQAVFLISFSYLFLPLRCNTTEILTPLVLILPTLKQATDVKICLEPPSGPSLGLLAECRSHRGPCTNEKYYSVETVGAFHTCSRQLSFVKSLAAKLPGVSNQH
ncbi:hypothetical protein LX36DRAFT_343452 [Colletotrichum falcatum]|nr:hypothetical protein LX36DRAFT_343452 [Colletotrichum falcatum]